jgi:tellurite resistance protein
MKTTIKNAVIGLFTLVAVIAVNVANATTMGEVNPAAELKLITHIDNQPVFQLSLKNAEKATFVVIVKDEFGTVVYQETVVCRYQT